MSRGTPKEHMQADGPHWNFPVREQSRNASAPYALRIVAATLGTPGDCTVERLEASCCIHDKTLKAHVCQVAVPKKQRRTGTWLKCCAIAAAREQRVLGRRATGFSGR